MSKTYLSSEAFRAQAHIKSLEEYEAIYQRSVTDPEGYWAEQAKSLLTWAKEPTQVLDKSNAPFFKWFADGELNVSYNCVDRHLAERGDKVAILWEGEPGDIVKLTYKQLHTKVCQFANVLKSLGIEKGDRVALYMPMVPELPIAMLACARLGAPHSIVFGGFSAEALATRIQDAEAKVVVTADGGWRRGRVVPLKRTVDDALASCPSVGHVVVVRRCDNDIAWVDGRDLWYDDLMADASPECDAPAHEAEHPLYILYTSGTTGKPKGVVHTSGGYLLGCQHTTRLIFDLKEEDVYWCTADIGWVTGHSYVCYGPLANGATTVMYEGAPDTPDWSRFWDMVERHHINILYTAPTAIRAFMKQGEAPIKKHDLSSLRVLGSVGEPINPAAWEWYHEVIGGGRCPIVDTWWQTETGVIMISPLPGCTPMVPGSATRPFFGVDAMVVDEAGNKVEPDHGGLLVVRQPWPGMFRTLYKDPDRYIETYWSRYREQGWYLAGDGARYDQDGNIWVTGRIDDVLNVSGHRLGTAEVESALVSHETVAEAAVVGFPHDIKGEGICAFVTLKTGFDPSDDLKKDLVGHVRKVIGAIAAPDQIRFTSGLPKTRSGKIMRRLLRDIAVGRETTGDTTALEDLNVLARLRSDDED